MIIDRAVSFVEEKACILKQVVGIANSKLARNNFIEIVIIRFSEEVQNSRQLYCWWCVA